MGVTDTLKVWLDKIIILADQAFGLRESVTPMGGLKVPGKDSTQGCRQGGGGVGIDNNGSYKTWESCIPKDTVYKVKIFGSYTKFR